MPQEASATARRVLNVDGLAGCAAGLLVLALLDWLTRLHQLPGQLLLFMGIVNLLYGSYSGSLALRARRGPMPGRRWIDLLIIGNTGWALVCIGLAVSYWNTASIFGLVHLLFEAAFVLFLAILERRLVRPFTA